MKSEISQVRNFAWHRVQFFTKFNSGAGSGSER